MSLIKSNNNFTQTVFWSFHRVVVEEAGLPGYCAVWLGNFFTTFWRNQPPSSSGWRVGSRASRICCYSSSPVAGFIRYTWTERFLSLHIVLVSYQHYSCKLHAATAIHSGEKSWKTVCWKFTLNVNVWALTCCKNYSVKEFRFGRNNYLTSCNYVRGVRMFQNSRSNFNAIIRCRIFCLPGCYPKI